MKVTKDELPSVVGEVLRRLPPKEERAGRAALITLSGDLGAGKTTLVQELARALGIQEAVQSPTYVLMKSYALEGRPFSRLVHIDAYRLNNAQEFEALNPEEFLHDENALVALEWPERIEGALPKADVALALSSEAAEAQERYIQFV